MVLSDSGPTTLALTFDCLLLERQNISMLYVFYLRTGSVCTIQNLTFKNGVDLSMHVLCVTHWEKRSHKSRDVVFLGKFITKPLYTHNGTGLLTSCSMHWLCYIYIAEFTPGMCFSNC